VTYLVCVVETLSMTSLSCLWYHILIEHINICRYKGGPEIPRKVIFDNPTDKTYVVDVYPLCLKLIDARDGSEKVFRISRKVKWHYFISLLDIDIKLFT
jgi:hypothetical protein